MNHETESHDLGEAVRAFQTAEEALNRLSVQAEQLAGAGEQLTLARESLASVRELCAEALQQQANLTEELTAMSRGLVDATEIVRRNDPAKVFQAIDRLSSDFDRQKDRVSEMAGELKARVDESTRSIEGALDARASAMTAAAEQRSQRLGKRLWLPAMTAALFAALAAILQIVDLATR